MSDIYRDKLAKNTGMDVTALVYESIKVFHFYLLNSKGKSKSEFLNTEQAIFLTLYTIIKYFYIKQLFKNTVHIFTFVETMTHGAIIKIWIVLY